MIRFLALACILVIPTQGMAADSIDVWPSLAPGETTQNKGVAQPRRPNENPPVTRVEKITQPTIDVFPAAHPNGTGVVILPGGGFAKVVPDKEGSEAAQWLNKHGITAFVVRYRTTTGNSRPGWKPALQDSQRAFALIRSRAADWGLKPDRIGLLGFSAGGQVAARHLTDRDQLAYDRIDEIDDVSHRPDFALLIYPWNIYDTSTDSLAEGIVVSEDCPATYIVHTDDDRSSALGAVLFYAGLKRLKINSELHVYGNGGHGYGLRPVPGSQISSWTDHAAHWLGTHGYTIAK